MIKTTAIMLQELNNYKNPRDKLAHMVKQKERIPVIQGLYETNPTTDTGWQTLFALHRICLLNLRCHIMD